MVDPDTGGTQKVGWKGLRRRKAHSTRLDWTVRFG
jgi:hypothetical protein